MACGVFVDLGCPNVVVVVFWSVELCCGVNIGVHFEAHSKGVEMCEVEDVEFVHDWLRVRAWLGVFYDSDDFFLYANEGWM